MRALLLILLTSFCFSLSAAEISDKVIRGKLSKIKITIKDGSILTGIFHSHTDSSILFIPNVNKKKEVKALNFELKEVLSKDILKISIKRKGRGAAFFWWGLAGGSAVALIVGASIGGYAIIGAGLGAVGVAIISGIAGVFPVTYKINFADRLSPEVQRKLKKNSFYKDPKESFWVQPTS